MRFLYSTSTFIIFAGGFDGACIYLSSESNSQCLGPEFGNKAKYPGGDLQ